MESLFKDLKLLDIHQDLLRNIPSLIRSENLFDDLSDSPEDWNTAIQVELDGKPKDFISPTPIIHRPFEDSAWNNVIDYPFKNSNNSRFSAGSYGVWYGADSVETTIYESAYHWYTVLLSDAGFNQDGMITERVVYYVRCDAALINLKEKIAEYPQIIDPNDYAYCQFIGSRLHHEGHPGLVSQSVRNIKGETYAIFRPQVLSASQIYRYYSYEIKGNDILVFEDGKKKILKISN